MLVDTRILRVALVKEKKTLADISKETHIDMSNLSKIFNEKREANSITIAKICEALNLDPDKVVL